MSDATVLRVGVSESFRTSLPGILDAFLDAHIGPYPWITHEPFVDTPLRPDALARYDAIIADWPEVTPLSFPGGSAVRTTMIARWGVGYDTIDTKACSGADVALAITSDAVRRPMAEAIVTLFLALAKGVTAKDRLVRSGRWDLAPRHIGVGLGGRTVGSVGLGNIGAEMFRLLKPFDCGRLLAYDPYAPRDVAAALGVELVDLDTIFAASDFVAVNCPLNRQTRGLITGRELSLMKPTAYFVNTARGAIVDHADLVAALRTGAIAGAGLDVFAEEPLPASDPLIGLDNVILAPHALGYTDDLVRGNSVGVCENVLAMLQGKIPPFVVNKDVLERPTFQGKLASLGERWRMLANGRTP